MVSDPGAVQKVFCPACGQKLAIPTLDLQSAYACPRCHSTHLAGDLIPKGATVPGVPVDLTPSPGHSMRAIPVLAQAAPGAALHPALVERQESPPLLVSGPTAAPAHAPTLGPSQSNLLDARALLDAARDTAAVANVVVAKALDAAEWIDARLHRWRSKAFFILCSLVAFAEFAAALADVDPLWVELPAFLLLAVLSTTLLLARVASFRDERGAWSIRMVGRRIASAAGWAWQSIREFWQAPWLENLRLVGLWVMTVGLGGVSVATFLGLVLRVVTLAIDVDASVAAWTRTLAFVSWVFSAVGVAILFVRWRVSGSLPGATRPVDSRARAAARAEVLGLPFVLDFVHDRAAASRAVGALPESLLRQVLAEVAAWRPHRRFELERDYQESLCRHIARRLPDLSPELERPFSTQSSRGRLDLVVGDAVVLEMKHSVSASEAQRAAGQLMQYATFWGAKGPVILVVCETSQEFATSLIGELVAGLRSAGYPVLAVAAGFSSS